MTNSTLPTRDPELEFCDRVAALVASRGLSWSSVAESIGLNEAALLRQIAQPAELELLTAKKLSRALMVDLWAQ